VCANVTGNIRDQSDCGSCWAVSTSGAVTDRHCIATNGAYTTQLSGTDTMSCCNGDHGCPGSDGCNGGIPEVRGAMGRGGTTFIGRSAALPRAAG
jgi:hypothetical protein